MGAGRDIPRVERVGVPGRLAADGMPARTDYADAFWVAFPAGDLRDLARFGRAVFSSPPRWVRMLMAIRNRLVAPWGLKTPNIAGAGHARQALRIGDTLGLFHVKSLKEDEIVLGEDDRHLSFRVSLLRQERNGRSGVTLTTAVQFHNLFGRWYFVPVRPFHRLIVTRLMRRAAGRER